MGTLFCNSKTKTRHFILKRKRVSGASITATLILCGVLTLRIELPWSACCVPIYTSWAPIYHILVKINSTSKTRTHRLSIAANVLRIIFVITCLATCYLRWFLWVVPCHDLLVSSYLSSSINCLCTFNCDSSSSLVLFSGTDLSWWCSRLIFGASTALMMQKWRFFVCSHITWFFVL